MRPRLKYLAFALIAIYAILLIPAPTPVPPAAGENKTFAWQQDEYWTGLEARFRAARSGSCDSSSARIDTLFARQARLVASLEAQNFDPAAPIFAEIESHFFTLAPLVAACPAHLQDYVELQSRLRAAVKRQSQHWNLVAAEARGRLYRLLYGSRAAVEEAMLQAPVDSWPALAAGVDEPSQTPAANVLGVTIHSGDILVSRGGAPTSALIARGNDYPGNFSHIALVHVDEQTRLASIVEAHIERGVAIATLEEYLRDKKLRVMVLRLRADLPALTADAMLPHRAAGHALQEARNRHIPYDFEMDFRAHDKLFCSEVASAAYEQFGVDLWMGISRISSPGVRSWLAAFGVKHFETQEPADLEYDPQLRVVAEWRDPETLWQDHVDNAVIDAMLEGAEHGGPLPYAWHKLPPARIAKAYSVLLNAFGRAGPIPEGMNATAALRNDQFTKTHLALKETVLRAAQAFEREKGYRPPYWELVKLARAALGRQSEGKS